MAVDLAKMSVWLATLAKDHPLTFLDHALRHGDSLLGLNRQQIERFHWKGHKKGFEAGLEAELVRKQVDQVARLRREIQSKRQDTPQEELKGLWCRAEDKLERVRLLGDLVLSAFFRASNTRTREKSLKEYGSRILRGEVTSITNPLSCDRFAAKPLASFHWEIEFPEVFDRLYPGFDALIGNPPFAGKNAVIRGNAPGYIYWLKTLHEESHGNADLSAHFFRRAFSLLRWRGNLGLIATNTIAQGDTRSTGLRWICKHGGKIFSATRRLTWPGQAAVIVSVVHIHYMEPRDTSDHLDDTRLENECHVSCELDGSDVESISAFLVPGNSHDDPVRLEENTQQSFVGSYILGMGFTFDDTDKKGAANAIDDMDRLISADSRNAEVIMPYIGGAELNSSPTQAYHRFVINFRNFPLRRDSNLTQLWESANDKLRSKWMSKGIVPLDYPHSVAADWPELLEIATSKVYPYRKTKRRKALRERWWHYAEKRPGLYRKVKGLRRVLTVARVGKHILFAFLPNNEERNEERFFGQRRGRRVSGGREGKCGAALVAKKRVELNRWHGFPLWAENEGGTVRGTLPGGRRVAGRPLKGA